MLEVDQVLIKEWKYGPETCAATDDIKFLNAAISEFNVFSI